MPNQEATPRRTMRIPDELWFEAQRVAKGNGETVTDAVIRLLTRYVREAGVEE